MNSNRNGWDSTKQANMLYYLLAASDNALCEEITVTVVIHFAIFCQPVNRNQVFSIFKHIHEQV